MKKYKQFPSLVMAKRHIHLDEVIVEDNGKFLIMSLAQYKKSEFNGRKIIS